ncbi:type IV secretion system DNA-binding domain-containing protein [Halalkalicoccus subterraneus]|uniref:type IV secretion system DNA-binding domain-containing protein n=1 Tax=Halalkalicoccus subterraneus TaxID=2675002 RepID=UPI001FE3229F|nr:type IV secretion system DNA-binding domain-containing protein [Halalkalicoccus subterraneus]
MTWDRSQEPMPNAELVNYFSRATPEKIHEHLTRDGHEDLTAAASAINPETERQAGSVFVTAQQQITDLFVGDFAESGEFSIREYIQNPDGRVLVLNYPTRQSGTIASVFRYLIDQSIMHGMDNPDRSAYYLLDEIEHLDATIKRLGELINVGRGVNCQAILSLQSVAQLEDTYGKERAHTIEPLN